MTQKKVFVVGGGLQYMSMFLAFGFLCVTDSKEADLMCFTGGADVSPYLYGAKQHHTTFTSPGRDENERRIFEEAQALGIPCVGICRGAQFLNVMSGGSMYQNVSNHTRAHDIVDKFTGEKVFVSSTHHQMMKPSADAIIVATATEGSHREWFEGEDYYSDVSNEDYEVLFYKGTKSLCFQPHPEFSPRDYGQEMLKYFRSLIQQYLEV